MLHVPLVKTHSRCYKYNMKILYIASTFGHIRSFHLPYINALIAKGHSVDVAGAGDPSGIPAEAGTFILPFEKHMSASSNFRAASMLKSKLSAERYDTVIMHTSLAAFFTRLAIRRTPSRIRPLAVNMVHGYLFDAQSPFARRTVLLAAEKLTAGVTNRLIVMNDEDLKIALSQHLCKSDSEIYKIPGVGFDSHRFFPRKAEGTANEDSSAPKTFNMIYAAEFSKRKNQAFLLYVLKELLENSPKADYRLTLAGTGAELESCKILASELGIANSVSFPGFVNNIEDYYAASDLSLSASRSEGLPFNVLESLACGLPVVASRVKGHTDLIRPGENGELYDFGDIKACAAAIKKVCENTDLYHPTEGIEHYALENVLESNLSLLL